MQLTKLILKLYKTAVKATGRGVPVSAIMETGLFELLIKMKYDIPNDKPEMFGEYEELIDEKISALN